jgi:Uncharacterized protein conserved in bacteria
VLSCTPSKPFCANISCGRRPRRSQKRSPAPSPFCLDTLAPFEWLQWVLIPRMHALLEGGHPLPQAFAVSPYYEMALEATHPARDVMLVELEKLDALFAGEDA